MPGLLPRLFLGNGSLPPTLLASLQDEVLLAREEGVRGTVTYRHYHGPGESSNWAREWIRAGVGVSRERFVVINRGQHLIHVGFRDPRFHTLELGVQEDALHVGIDPHVFDERKRGRIEVALRVADPGSLLATVRGRLR
jgi:hypothetical protein